jgi:hypothetical protein
MRARLNSPPRELYCGMSAERYKISIEVVHGESADSLILALVHQGYMVWLENDDVPGVNPDICFVIPGGEVSEIAESDLVRP